MEFQKFPKIPRLSRDIVITEKIDGTNAIVFITNFLRYPDYVNWVHLNQCNLNDYIVQLNEDGYNFVKKYSLFEKDGTYIFAGSKNRWLDTSSKGDNFGFAKWVQSNAEELLQLGEGKHYGEYFGKGIQRNYGLDEKRFALFNVNKWHKFDHEKRLISINPKTKEEKFTQSAPKCCEVVPILYEGIFDTNKINEILTELKKEGSCIAPGFMNPEGIVVWHSASGHLYKKTCENDEKPKGL